MSAAGPGAGRPEPGGAPAGGGPGPELRLHTDGASRGNPGPAAIGVLIERLPDGAVVDEISRYLGHATNNVAEYQALIAGLRRAAELGASAVEVWSDSELLVRQIEGRYQVKHPALVPLFAEASRLRRAFGAHFRIRHTLRGGNARADELANLALDAAARGAAGPGRGGAVPDGSGRAAPAGPGAGMRRPPVPEAAPPGGTARPGSAAGPAGSGSAAAPALAVPIDVFAIAGGLPAGGAAEVGPGVWVVRLAPNQDRDAAWGLLLRGAVAVAGRLLEPGQCWRGPARYRAGEGEDAIVLEVRGAT